MKGLIGLGVLVALVGWLFFGWFRAPVYTGYFYPQPYNYDNVVKQSGLVSLDACRSWVNTQVARDSDGEYDYECGKDCKLSGSGFVDRCKTTER